MTPKIKTLFSFAAIFLFPILLFAQTAPEIPSVYSKIVTRNDSLFVEFNGKLIPEADRPARYTLKQMQGQPKGTETGLEFFFGEKFSGKMYYGFIPYGDSKHPHPVYFRSWSSIKEGKASINISRSLSGLYDMVGWYRTGKGTLGYRVVTDKGAMIYDGIVSFKGTGPFEVDHTIIEGPFINLLNPKGATISFTTNKPVKAKIQVNGKYFSDQKAGLKHEIEITGLASATKYDYTVHYGDNQQSYSFQTAPNQGARKEFIFAYASDSRSGQGGGERDLHGANSYIMKRILALCKSKDAAFMQFSGDLINGYLNSLEETNLQYANWKRAIQPFAHYFPVVAGMGNHEALTRRFQEAGSRQYFTVDRFPFATESAEFAFAQNFVNPLNGPESEDGAYYDPDTTSIDFPSYKENVFYYTYDNVAVIVLNSDYFYAPTTSALRITSGGMHGYIMDNQLKWLEQTLGELEVNKKIDHIFVTQHTPCFPNGGHVHDDMWYRGNNQKRPYVAKKAVRKGIIERRDQILNLLVNKSKKVRAVLTGDEHNYNRLRLTPQTEIYPENYLFSKTKLKRTIYQINNGAAGAPYYAQERTPWTPYVSNFTTQNAVVFFHVKKKRIRVEVINPDTLELVDEFILN